MLPDDYKEVSSEPAVPQHPNLKPFKPGQSGNPLGRVPGSKNRATIARILAETEIEGTALDGKSGFFTAESLYMAALVRKALEGDINAIKELQDTLYGKLTDKQELTGAGGEPLSAIVRTVVDPKANDNA